MYTPPMSIDDVGARGFEKPLVEMREKKAEETAWAAYPAEMRESQEEEPGPSEETFFDDITTDEDLGDSTREKLAVEDELMEEIPLPAGIIHR